MQLFNFNTILNTFFKNLFRKSEKKSHFTLLNKSLKHYRLKYYYHKISSLRGVWIIWRTSDMSVQTFLDELDKQLYKTRSCCIIQSSYHHEELIRVQQYQNYNMIISRSNYIYSAMHLNTFPSKIKSHKNWGQTSCRRI